MKRLIPTVLVLLLLLIVMEPAMAGPGGKIASTVFHSFWGRVTLAILCVLLFPFIAYTLATEWLAERRTMRDLQYMARQSPAFDWLKIRERVKDCFQRVHSGWQKEDLSDTASWMTEWYWQNQQQVHLDRWKREGLVNICEVKKITRIKPLLFVPRSQPTDHEDSMIAISITAVMKDYLQNRSTGKVVEGNKDFKDVETVWTFTLHNGAWRVSDIDEGGTSLAFAKLSRGLPAIETTGGTPARAGRL